MLLLKLNLNRWPNIQLILHPLRGGAIHPQGSLTAFSGDMISFSMTPEPDYVIDRVIVDGTSLGAVRSYPMLVHDDHTISVFFTRKETRSISGRIFDQDNPDIALPHFRIDVWQNDHLIASTINDADGYYTVEGLPVASDLVVSAWPLSENTSYQGLYYINQTSMQDANRLVVIADNLEGIDLYIPKKNEEGFQGQVRDQNGGIADVVVHMSSRNGDHNTSVVTDSGGFYQIQGLMPDMRYQLSYRSLSLNQEFFFYLPDHLTPGIDAPESSVTSANIATWIKPSRPLLENINIIVDPNTGATIAGHVFLADSQMLPLSNVVVHAWSPGLHIGNSTTTDLSGAFVLYGLKQVSSLDAPNNGYQIEILSDNYVYQAFPQANRLSEASLIETDRTDIDFYISDYSTITGQVVDNNHQGVNKVLIQAVSEQFPWKKQATTTSDFKGFYTLTVPVASDYMINASKQGYDIQYYNQSANPEMSEQVDARFLSISNINFQLDDGASLQGFIYIGSIVTPASNVRVTIRSEQSDFLGQCQTNDQGFYKMTGLEESVTDYIIQCQLETYMPAYYSDNGDEQINNDTVYNRNYAAGVSPSETNRNLILVPGYQVRGHILDGDEPVYGISVEAHSETTGGWGRVISQDVNSYQYEISGLPPGIYTITATGKSYQTQSKTVTLVRQTTYLDFVMTMPQRIISGVVYGLDRDDMVWVKAMSVDQSFEKMVKLMGTDAAVPFRLENLQSAGDYLVYVFGNDYPSLFYPDQPTMNTAKLIDVTQSNVENIAFHMPSKTTRRLSGTIQFADSCTDGTMIQISAHSDSYQHEKTIFMTCESGINSKEYSIEGLLSASDYRVKVVCESCVDLYYPQAVNILNASLVSTLTQNAEDINFTLSTGASIQGTISATTDKTIHMIASSEKLNVQIQTMPQSDGTFTIKGLEPSDDYVLSALIQDIGVFYYHPETTLRSSEKSVRLSVINGNLTDIHFTVIELQFIAGTIKSEQGNAMAGVFVSCQSTSMESGSSTYSDKNGAYTILGLIPASDYVVTATPDNTEKIFHQSMSLENISSGDNRVDFVLQAISAYDISGEIVDSMNNPIEYAMVEIQSIHSANQYDRARTDKQGMFTLKGLPQNTDYMLWVWPGSDQPYAYYRQTNISIPSTTFYQITLASAPEFGGIVLDDFTGEPIQNVVITAFSDLTGFFQKTQTNETGAYTVTNAPLTTDYRITFHHDHYLDQEFIQQSPHHAINVKLAASGCIAGTVNSSQTATSVEDARVDVFSFSFDTAPDYIGTGLTDSDGNYRICNLKQRDQSGNIVSDYQVQVLADGYPIVSRGGLTVNEQADFMMESHPQFELYGTIDDTLNMDIMIRLFDQSNNFLKNIGVDSLGTFKITGLSPENSYKLNLNAYQENELVIDAWGTASGQLVDNEVDAKLFETGQEIIILLSIFDSGKKRSKKNVDTYNRPGPVRNLRSLSHPFVWVSNRLRTSASAVPAEVTNNPNVEMTWDPPENEDVSGYFYSFDQNEGHTFNDFNTVQKPPVRTRKITSRNLEGDDVSYYFHVAPVDQTGRIGQTTSIAFRIDSTKPTNVNVSLPETCASRDVQLNLGADGAVGMYVSNTGYDTGGLWESLNSKKQWQLTLDKGSKNVYARFRDRAGNISKTTGQTNLIVGELQHIITITANENGQVAPSGTITVDENDCPEIQIIPNSGFYVSRMTLDDYAVQLSGKSYTFSPVTEDHNLNILFSAIHHTVYMSTSANGHILPAGPVSVDYLQDLDIQFNPDPGFALSHITIDGVSKELTSNTYTIQNIQQDTYLTAHFKAAFTLNAIAENYGSVQPETVGVLEGRSHAFSFIPDSGFAVSQLWIDDIEVPIKGNSYTFYNVRDNHTLRVAFDSAQFSIVALAGANGNIVPSGTISVGGMSQKQFNIQADDGYMINQVLVDDQAVTVLNNSYTFKDIADHHKLFVSFRRLNYPPEIADSSFETNEDVSYESLLQATDPNDDDVLIFSISSQPSNGSINLNTQTGAFIYQSRLNFHGTDQFQYIVNDGLIDSETATVQITIHPVNDAPEAFSGTLSAIEESSTVYTLTANDVDSTQLTFSLVSLPEKGSLTLTDPQKGICVYRPSENVVGSDTFSFKVSDGQLDSTIANVTISIKGENDPPVISAQTITVDEDTQYTFTLSVVDPENDPMFFNMVSSGQLGDATIIDPIEGHVIYTPKANVSGTDAFEFSVTDNQAEAQSAMVSVTIMPVNDPPVAFQQQINVFANEALGITFTASDVDSNVFTFDIVETPEHGSLSGVPPHVLFHPNADYEGSDQLIFSVSDADNASHTATIFLTITPPPDAFAKEDQSTSIEIPSYATIKTFPDYGQLMGTPPNLTYQPDQNFFGTDTFTYQYNDQTESFSIYVAPVNDAPTIEAPESVQTDAGQSASIDIYINDIDRDELQIQWGQPAHGSVSGNSSQLVYTPYPSYSGMDLFHIEAFDGYVQTQVTIQILVGKVNQAPEAKDRTINAIEDIFVEITLPAVDPDFDTLSYTIVQGPSHGTLSGTPPSVVYQPDHNYHGQDSIGFTANDSMLTSNIGYITLVIEPQNDPPVAINTRIDTFEDQQVNGTLLANDVDLETIRFQLIQNGQQGIAQILDNATGTFTYQPYSNVFGTDILAFKANDTVAQSNIGYVTITIFPVNDPPKGFSSQWETDEDTLLDETLKVNDPDSSQFIFSIIDPPKLGALTLTNNANGSIRYTPSSNLSGQDQFTYKVGDFEDESRPVQVTIDIHSVNDPPVSQSFNFQLNEDTDYSGKLPGSDVDSSVLTYEIVLAPQKGNIEWTDASNGQFVYQPLTNIFGSDQFTYHISDGSQTSETSLVSIQIEAVNDRPVLESDDIESDENQVVHLSLMASDSDDDPLTFYLISIPENGTASIQGAGLTYTPHQHYIGVETIMVQADDGFSRSKTASIQFWVGIHQADIIATEDEPISFTLPQGAVITKPPEMGTIEIIDNEPVYTPHPNNFGDDLFTYNSNGTDITVTIFIKPVNDSPVFDLPSVITIDEDQPVVITSTIIDPDTPFDQFIASIDHNPQHGSLQWDGNIIEYHPFDDYYGNDSFSIRISDGFENSFDTLTVQLNITPQNDAPRPKGQTVSLVEDTQINIDLTATDIENDPIKYVISNWPSHGKLTGSPPDMVYTPDLDYFGTDRFWFTAKDMISSSQATPVTILVIGSSDIPVAYPSILTVPDTSPVFGQLSAYDPDGDLLTYNIVTQSSKGYAMIIDAATGKYSYTPNPGESGEDFFTFRVNDTQFSSNIEFVSIEIATTQVTYHQLTLSLEGDYLAGDAYDYTIIETASNKLVKKDRLSQSVISTQLPENTYTFIFSGIDYEPFFETINLMADITAPITIQSNPNIFKMSIDLQGDYFPGDDINVTIMDANTQEILKSIESNAPTVGARLVAGIYTFTIKAFNYEPYTSSLIYLDKDRVITIALIEKTTGAGELTIDLNGDYQAPDPYRCVIINSKTGEIEKDQQGQEQTVTIQINAGKYRVVIIADNYEPLECQYMGERIIEVDPAARIQAVLTQSSFKQEPPRVDVSHMEVANGLSIKFTPFYFSKGLTIKLGGQTIITKTNNPLIYNWKLSSPLVQAIENKPYAGDRFYDLDFQFFDDTTPVGHYQINYTDYASEDNKTADRPEDQQKFENRYGEASNIAHAEGIFYPLMGISLPVIIKDNSGTSQTLQVNVPPLPLEYLYIDNATSSSSGLLNYQSYTDIYQASVSVDAHPEPDDPLKIVVHHYCFDHNAGSGITISFHMAEGTTYAGASVRYNPILNNHRPGSITEEILPVITVPLILNRSSQVYSSLSNYLDQRSIANIRVNERGDQTNGLRLESVAFTRYQDLINFKMRHLTSIGFDVEEYIEPEPEPEPEPDFKSEGDSGGCFIESLGSIF
jgi:VCBS repeat-containing protein